MGKLAKLKREHIQKVNKQLNERSCEKEVDKKEIKLYPSDNVQGVNQSFLNKMSRL